MTNTFRSIDLLRVALQVKGASQVEIEDTLSALRKCAKPHTFDSWNRELSEKEIQVMVVMLSPGGESLCDRLLSTFGASCVEHFEITPEQVSQFLHGRFGGLN